MSCLCQDFNILLTVEGITGAPDDLDSAIKLCFYKQKHFREPDGGGGIAGRAEFKDVVVVKNFDQYSPILAISVANDQHFPSAVIYFLDKTSNDVFYKVTLREISFTHFEQTAFDFNDSGLLGEIIRIHYEQIEWEWNGTLRCWNISENSAC